MAESIESTHDHPLGRVLGLLRSELARLPAASQNGTPSGSADSPEVRAALRVLGGYLQSAGEVAERAGIEIVSPRLEGAAELPSAKMSATNLQRDLTAVRNVVARMQETEQAQKEEIRHLNDALRRAQDSLRDANDRHPQLLQVAVKEAVATTEARMRAELSQSAPKPTQSAPEPTEAERAALAEERKRLDQLAATLERQQTDLVNREAQDGAMEAELIQRHRALETRETRSAELRKIFLDLAKALPADTRRMFTEQLRRISGAETTAPQS